MSDLSCYRSSDIDRFVMLAYTIATLSDKITTFHSPNYTPVSHAASTLALAFVRLLTCCCSLLNLQKTAAYREQDDGPTSRRLARREYHKKIERKRRDRMRSLYDELRALTDAAELADKVGYHGRGERGVGCDVQLAEGADQASVRCCIRLLHRGSHSS